MQDDQESRIVGPMSEIKYEDYKNYWYTLKIPKSSVTVIYRAVRTVLSFLIKLLLPRGQESLAAKSECCEIHEKM